MRYLLFAFVVLCSGLWANPLIDLPPSPSLTSRGYKLILDYEVGGGRNYYEQFLAHPTWPGASSGVTVGVGYDCGYNSSAIIIKDWLDIFPNNERLAKTAGITGYPAKLQLSRIRDILIAWDPAERVFNRVTITRFWQLTRRTFPGFDSLHSNCQAALVSLIFNRGNSLAGPSRIEMREIARLTPHKDYSSIASQVRSMKRLWQNRGLDGLIRRREAEAQLIESCR